MKTKQAAPSELERNLQYLKLAYVPQHYNELAQEASQKELSHVEYLARLMAGEAALRHERSIARRIQLARFPVVKTLDQFSWSWPKSINRLQVQDLFRLQFIADKANVIFLGGVGLGKTHLATAQAAGRLKQELKKYTKPALLILDELGYLPIDKAGADLLFQVISLRYEQGAMVITSNRAFKDWPEIFNNDATLTSAILDRLLHHAQTVVIEGTSYRMKDQIES